MSPTTNHASPIRNTAPALLCYIGISILVGCHAAVPDGSSPDSAKGGGSDGRASAQGGMGDPGTVRSGGNHNTDNTVQPPIRNDGGVSSTNIDAATGAAMPIDQVHPRFCNDPAWRVGAQDGVHTTAEIAKSLEGINDPAYSNVPAGLTVDEDPPDLRDDAWKYIFVPKQYAEAKSGEVGVVVFFGGDKPSLARARAAFANLIRRKEMPVAIGVVPSFGPDQPFLVSAELKPALRAKLSKLSENPLMWVVTGGSTGGAQAFDLVWSNPQVIGSALLESASFVCFRPNYPYDALIDRAPPKNVRVALAVGTCDIWGTPERWPAMCGGSCGKPLCIDASNCQADWLPANTKVAEALARKKYPYQLLIVDRGRHGGSGIQNLADQLRWIFRPFTCGDER